VAKIPKPPKSAADTRAILGKLEGQTYVTSGYLATLAAFLVLAGALGDYYGRRRMFIIGLVGFGATSVLCGVAPSLELLVIGRVTHFGESRQQSIPNHRRPFLQEIKRSGVCPCSSRKIS